MNQIKSQKAQLMPANMQGEEAIEDHLCNDCLSDRDREKARDQREAFIEAMS